MKQITNTVYATLLILFLTSCALMENNPLVGNIVVKDSVVAAIGLSTKDEAKRKEYAEKITQAATGALEAIDGDTSLTKAKIIEILDRELAKQDMEFFVKMILQDVVLVLDSIYPVDVPTLTIPEEDKPQIKAIFEAMIKGASLFL